MYLPIQKSTQISKLLCVNALKVPCTTSIRSPLKTNWYLHIIWYEKHFTSKLSGRFKIEVNTYFQLRYETFKLEIFLLRNTNIHNVCMCKGLAISRSYVGSFFPP